MKILPVLVSAAVLAVGLFGGTLAYQAAAGSGVTSPTSQSTAAGATPAADRGHHQRPTVRWAPCKPPAVRDGRACVTEEVRTVVVPAPAAPAPAPAPAPARVAPVSHAAAAGDDHGDDDGRSEHEHEHEDHGEHESEDD